MNIDGFIAYMQTRTRSSETVRAYRQDLEKYQDFLRSRHLRINQATTNDIDEFIQHLNSQPTRKSGEQLAPASIARRLSVVSKYYEFLRARSNGRLTNPVTNYERPKIDNDRPRALDDSTVEQLMSGITDPRDRSLIGLFIWSGLRLSELHQLNKDTIMRRQRRMPDGQLRTIGRGTVTGKGSKVREFIIDDQTLNNLVDYLKLRGQDDCCALFVSNRQQRLSRRSIQDILYRWCRRLELSPQRVHALRHTFATKMANAGMSSAVLKDLLGHSSYTATQRYFRIRPERLAREYFAAFEYITK